MGGAARWFAAGSGGRGWARPASGVAGTIDRRVVICVRWFLGVAKGEEVVGLRAAAVNVSCGVSCGYGLLRRIEDPRPLCRCSALTLGEQTRDGKFSSESESFKT